MKRLVIGGVFALCLVAFSFAAETSDPQMEIFRGIARSNSWTTLAIAGEVIGMYFLLDDLMVDRPSSVDNISSGFAYPLSFMLFVPIQAVSSFGRTIRFGSLDDSITTSGRTWQRPTRPLNWSLLATASTIVEAIVFLSLSTSDIPVGVSDVAQVIGGLTVIFTGVMSVVATNAYGREIGWSEYRKTHRWWFVPPATTATDSMDNFARGKKRTLRLDVPLISLQF